MTSSSHPKQKLLFFAAQEINDAQRSLIRDLVLKMARIRYWVNGPPRFVNNVDLPEDTSKGDLPVETIGGYIELYSDSPELLLPKDVDAQHLKEVTVMIEQLCDFSRQHRLSFELELDGNYVGSIDCGKMSQSLAKGLLGEWRQKLGLEF